MAAVSRLRDWGLLLACNLIWGCQFVVLKLVQEQMGPLSTTFVPLALATLVLIPIVRHEGGRANTARRSGPMPRKDFVGFLLIGIFGQVVNLLFGTWGVRLTLASNAALIVLSLPVTTAVLAYFLLGERMTTVRVVSFGLAIAGVLECSGVNWRELDFANPQFLLGNFMCYLAILGSAFYNTYTKKLLDRYSALRIVLYSYACATLFTLPVTLYLEPESFRNLLHITPLVWLGLLFLALLRNVLALAMFLNVLSRLEATVVGLSNYLIPFFGVLTAGIVLHERLTKYMLLGGMLVLASTLLVTVYEGRERKRAASNI